MYIILRACMLSLVHDEALSATLLYSSFWGNTANNHLLNTFLMKLSAAVFGASEFALRLPNVLSFILYITGVYLIFRKTRNLWLVIACSTVMLLNPFLLDFFSLARGYGLSLGLLMISLYFFLKNFFKDEDVRSLTDDFAISLFMGTTAVLANLSVINFYLAILVLFLARYALVLVRTRKNYFIVLSALFAGLLPLYFFLKRLLFLKNFNQLYFGEPDVDRMLKSLIVQSGYNIDLPSWIIQLLINSFPVLLIISVIIIVIRKNYKGELAAMTSLMILIFAGFIAEKILFNSLLPSGRSATFLLPLFGLQLFFFLKEADELLKSRYIGFVSIILIPIMLLLFSRSVNLHYTYVWRFDAGTKSMMKQIGKELSGTGNKTISNDWQLEPAINYYIRIENLPLIVAGRQGISDTTDYILCFQRDLPAHYKLVMEDEESNTMLLSKVNSDK